MDKVNKSYIAIANEIKLESVDRFLAMIDEQYAWKNMKISVIYEDCRKMFIYTIYRGWKRYLINIVSALLSIVVYPIIAILFIIDKIKYFGKKRAKVREEIIASLISPELEDCNDLSIKDIWRHCEMDDGKLFLASGYSIIKKYPGHAKEKIIVEWNKIECETT